jgi:hypothetical protein
LHRLPGTGGGESVSGIGGIMIDMRVLLREEWDALWRPMQELVDFLTSPEVTRLCASLNHRHLMRRKIRRMVRRAA